MNLIEKPQYRSLPGCMVDLLCGVGMPGVRRGVCPDISGNGRHGTVYGRPALEFGAGEYAAAAAPWDMLGGESRLVLAADVVVAVVAGEWQQIWAEFDSEGAARVDFSMNADARLGLYVIPEVDGDAVFVTGTAALSAGRHSIIALVDLQANGPTVYVDGEPYAIGDWNRTATAWDADTPSEQTIGAYGGYDNWLGRVIALGLVPGGSLDAAIAAGFHRDPTLWVAENCGSGSAEGWLINEGSGSTLNGLNGHDLTITGADWDLNDNGAQVWENAEGAGDAFPAEGYFIRGQEPDNYIETPAFTQPGTVFTILAVFTPHPTPYLWDGFASQHQTSGAYSGPWVGVLSSGRVAGFCGSYTADRVESADNAIVTGKKQMAAVVADGSTVRLWLDGAWASEPKAVVDYTPASQPLRAAKGAFTSQCPKVYIERAALYGRALTDGELNRIAKQHGVGG